MHGVGWARLGAVAVAAEKAGHFGQQKLAAGFRMQRTACVVQRTACIVRTCVCVLMRATSGCATLTTVYLGMQQTEHSTNSTTVRLTTATHFAS